MSQPAPPAVTPPLDVDDARDVVRRALDEDLGGPDGVDVTASATIPLDQQSTGRVVARADGVVAGLAVFALVWDDVARRLGCPQPQVTLRAQDGASVRRGDVLAEVTGPTQALLTGERTALNLVCRMSGVATHTRRWAEVLDGTGATVLDTRKTTPGLRALEKYAVRCGGGTNKRMGLYDVAMVKDNHKIAAGSVRAAYEAVRARYPDVEVQVEVTTVAEALEAVGAGARFLLCDNMSVDLLRETVDAVRAATPERVEIEGTGGLTLEHAREYGLTGVDYLSVGGLTHSSPILDIALDLV
ncbi:carboxylating nicotinate-nucleotide diphosphorylase [Angustibacter sp. Root456]|uniref:carboxylating nicotinate-nucleotide diphosphorylase n=1 Tax=Angustibacter sp. Root456 TaxID=1736539 RepID=UPI0006FCC7D3|nr:carboxylating nicotinate-nucleotide diphosphorylase [Angustibacter sp. Root456]KQX66345.1 nicotinate-nucleotide pyrophosphorylase [Angustibacter sp. Root456]